MLVFDKSLALSAQTKSVVGSGKILNMATADTNRVLDLFYMSTSILVPSMCALHWGLTHAAGQSTTRGRRRCS